MKFTEKKSVELDWEFKCQPPKTGMGIYYARFPAIAIQHLMNQMIEEFGEDVIVEMDLSHNFNEKSHELNSTINIRVDSAKENEEYKLESE